MNILWIEDFGGTLSSGTDTLESMFKNLLSFDDWDEDELNLIKRPTDLKKFCGQQKIVHNIHLCRNYFDYIAFKAAHSINNEIDTIITDIRLDNIAAEQFNLPIPEAYLSDKRKFHENGGFYIFNDLIHLGVPAERMCFMTGEKNSFKGFEQKCTEIYTPKVTAFEKSDADYEKLRDWLTAQQSSYAILRRGIIEACQYLKKQKEKLRFDKFCKEGKNAFLDIDDYLATLENFLPLREPSDKKTPYKLFTRTLAHEWEESVEPKDGAKALDDKGSSAFSWVMKMTRNWIAHNSTAIFTNLTEQDIAYLFICNMRAMFDLEDAVQPYEKNLFSLFNITDGTENKIINKSIPLIDTYVYYLNEKTNKIDIHNILNDLQNDKDKLQNKGDEFFITGLYHCFWFLTSSHDNRKDRAKPNDKNPNQVFVSCHYTFEFFDYKKTDFLFELARHIYSRSFL